MTAPNITDVISTTTSQGNALKISAQEIERKWLVKELPELSKLRGQSIRQGYVAISIDGTEVRVRQKGDKFFQTVKSDGALTRAEIEIELTQSQFENLWETTKDKRVEKVRYEIPHHGATLELDVYSGHLQGLFTVEVEFGSLRDSEQFASPSWFGKEITSDKRYKNKNLAVAKELPREN